MLSIRNISSVKTLFILLIGLLLPFSGSSQGCLPEGIVFSTQNQIDSFQINNPGCTEFEGDVEISWSDINSLNGLSQVKSIGGSLTIRSNPMLTNLLGLDNLTSIGEHFIISGNDALPSLAGLNSLQYVVGGILIHSNFSLLNLEGLEGLTSVEGIDLYNNSLTSLSGLDNITSVQGIVRINRNPELLNLSNLGNLKTIGENLEIAINDKLSNLAGLDNLTTIEGTLEIYYNDRLKDLTGLYGLTSIGADLKIYQNDSLISLLGLNNVTAISGSLEVNYSWLLNDLSALGNLTIIGGHLSIYDNPTLSSLEGINNINANSISGLVLLRNSSLTTCAIKSICDFLASPNDTIWIENNAPGCNSPEEIEAVCDTIGVFELSDEPELSIYPNPTSTHITIETPVESLLSIMNLNGKELLKQPITEPKTVVDISTLPNGIYFVRVTGDKAVHVGMFVKQ